ncbi:MAG: MFS transporter [Blastocatellia bacterium]|nr:MFS transporter [Blastocatellia bacterium]
MDQKNVDKGAELSSSAVTFNKPTRARYWVIFFAVTLAVITYIDRVCISQAAPKISAELGLTPVQVGFAFSAFTFAYALFEIPGGWLGDVLGARRVLLRIVIWWSLFTAATGWIWNLPSLLVTRFLFGAGEAGCFPNLTKAFMTWLPKRERVRAQGIMWLSARWGGAFTPPLVALILVYLSWRWAFMIFGLIGVVWAVFFFGWYRDNPREHPSVNDAEKEILPDPATVIASHGSPPWGIFLSSSTVWLLWLQYMFLSYGWYFYITWLPTYLQQARGTSLTRGALLSILPLFFGGIGSMTSGYLATYLEYKTGNVKTVRRWLAGIGFFGAAVCLSLSVNISNPLMAMIAMGLASFSNDLAMPPSWGACMDVGGKYAGTLSGSMNMMGNLGGAIGPIVVGFVLQATNHNWAVAFYISAAVYLLGIFCWMFIDPVTPLDEVKEDVLPNAAWQHGSIASSETQD